MHTDGIWKLPVDILVLADALALRAIIRVVSLERCGEWRASTSAKSSTECRKLYKIIAEILPSLVRLHEME